MKTLLSILLFQFTTNICLPQLQKDTLAILEIDENNGLLFCTNKDFSFDAFLQYNAENKSNAKLFTDYKKQKKILEIEFSQDMKIINFHPVEEIDVTQFFKKTYPNLDMNLNISIEENFAIYSQKYNKSLGSIYDEYYDYAIDRSNPFDIDTLIKASEEIYYEYLSENNCKSCYKDYPCLNYEELKSNCDVRADFIYTILRKKYGIDAFKILLKGGFKNNTGIWRRHVAAVVLTKEKGTEKYKVVDYSFNQFLPVDLDVYVKSLTLGNCLDSIPNNPFYFNYCVIVHPFFLNLPTKAIYKNRSDCGCIESYKVSKDSLELTSPPPKFDSIERTMEHCTQYLRRHKKKF